MELSQKHKVFAEEYTKTGNVAIAYKAAFPKAKNESAIRAKGSQLVKKESVKNYISHLQQLAEQKSVEIAANKIKPIFLSLNEKRNFLRQVALGEIEIEMATANKGKVVHYTRKANFSERLAAIELDSRLSGDLKQASNNDGSGEDKLLRIEGDKIIIVQNFNGLI